MLRLSLSPSQLVGCDGGVKETKEVGNRGSEAVDERSKAKARVVILATDTKKVKHKSFMRVPLFPINPIVTRRTYQLHLVETIIFLLSHRTKLLPPIVLVVNRFLLVGLTSSIGTSDDARATKLTRSAT